MNDINKKEYRKNLNSLWWKGKISKIRKKVSEKLIEILWVDPFNALLKLPFIDLKTLLLELFREKSEKMTVSMLKENYEKDRFSKPSNISQKELIYLDWLVYSCIPDNYNCLELSTVNPMWLNYLLWNISQNTLLSTVRWNELLWDATTVLALEGSKLRKELINNKDSKWIVRLCTTHRLTRWQSYEQEWFTPHFKTFNICIAWQTNWMLKFEIKSLYEMLDLYLNIINTLWDNWFVKNSLTVEISDLRIIEKILNHYWIDWKSITRKERESREVFDKLWVSIPTNLEEPNFESYKDDIQEFWIGKFTNTLWVLFNEVLNKLKIKYPDVKFIISLDRMSWLWYYHWISFWISWKNIDWEKIMFIDGWFTDWTQKLMNNKKERFLATWFWSEYFYLYFKSWKNEK